MNPKLLETANLSQIAQDFHQSLPVLSKLIKKSTGSTFAKMKPKEA